jgi:hypothetical protein
MKKTHLPRKLILQRDTVKTLKTAELTQVVGGAVTNACTHPTTTVLPSGPC